MKLEKILRLENVSVDTEATYEGKPVKETFCDHWKEARIGLELIGTVVKNPIAKLIVNIVINIGDGINEKFCPTP